MKNKYEIGDKFEKFIPILIDAELKEIFTNDKGIDVYRFTGDSNGKIIEFDVCLELILNPDFKKNVLDKNYIK